MLYHITCCVAAAIVVALVAATVVAAVVFVVAAVESASVVLASLASQLLCLHRQSRPEDRTWRSVSPDTKDTINTTSSPWRSHLTQRTPLTLREDRTWRSVSPDTKDTINTTTDLSVEKCFT